MNPVIQAQNINLGYKNEIIIKNASFSIYPKEFVFVSGPSGSGKSTLLRSMYGDLPLKSGSLEVCGVEMFKANKKNIEILRHHLGIIFQDYKLIKDFNVEKNVMLPMVIGGFTKESCQAQTDRLLAHIKLSHKGSKYPMELSGGEQQRVAMARALAHNPLLILADEPTGNLDDYSSEVIWNLLRGVNVQLGITVVVVTHRIPETLGINYRHFHIEEGVIYELS
ncbi:cell division ATP-binding protein FtsE [Helicobacter winghamensis]|uniref:cell division ATP-binding protein FtsE n=1 Tax=Helicobacter winghamensis TaxID=157268 RepID=UPI0001A28018|nr:ABC transporter ATP-binding protein [Helicobacter winghamensis]EEO25959.1 ABC transporter, ATP-binding protein [Helicobacter winghamensis ATCC BAA-430]PKT76972.1 ABC transporter ATP-binding protein [Helicobacter winghamensis]PKT77112.1 ABC transporter ATP-binding protein [Helicobacter winghamensis]QOQ98512.1 ABC transporter ATP-binding protein [Helicobacter winghamensis]